MRQKRSKIVDEAIQNINGFANVFKVIHQSHSKHQWLCKRIQGNPPKHRFTGTKQKHYLLQSGWLRLRTD